MPLHYLEMILKAQVYDIAKETPLDFAQLLSQRLDNKIYLKREDLQPVFSFKCRGAYNKLLSLSKEQREHGVIAASAGNHAQGVALSANYLGVHSLLVMPETTPSIKVSAVRRYGSDIILQGNTYDEAYVYAKKLAHDRKLVFIHPYDDPHVIAGQGTVAMEFMRQTKTVDAVFVPVGGGGLIAGISAYIKNLWPTIKIIGVEPTDAPCMYEALKANKRVLLPHVGIFADGVAVKQAGVEPFRIAQSCVDEIILVSTDEICAGIKDIFDDTRSIVEPAGALAVAGLKKYVEKYNISGQHLVAINSGANINFDRLQHVSERSVIGEKKEGLLAVSIKERPGSFLQFCQAIEHRGITEFNYRYSDPEMAHVFVGIQLNYGDKERLEIIEKLQSLDFPVTDLTNNEVAKVHLKHLVGGRAPEIQDEILIRFQFPERPGALLEFLQNVGQQWNISLFHYRNHGSDYGRVLIGIQVPNKDKQEFLNFLQSLGYRHWDETDNPIYTLFLGNNIGQ